MAHITPSDIALLCSPIDLPCGRTVPNRLAKAALYEAMAAWQGGPPNETHLNLYRMWAHGCWGIILTGNIQTSKDHLSMGRDMIVPDRITPESIAQFERLADAIHGLPSVGPSTYGTPLALAQLSHSGRQSPRFSSSRGFFKAPVSASDVPMKPSKNEGWLSKSILGFAFQEPRVATDIDIAEIVSGFVRGATLASKANFDGIQLHCSHGYLLAQFLSPKTNRRTDKYGPPRSLTLVQRIVDEIRDVVPPSFVVAVKLNASDYVQGGLTEDEALKNVVDLANMTHRKGRKSVDMIEISGGDYENPEMLKSMSGRQAFFSNFSRRALSAIKSIPNPPRIMLTGGFATPSLMAESLRAGHADILGVGRLSIAFPLFPRALLDGKDGGSGSDLADSSFTVKEPSMPLWTPPFQLINAGLGTAMWGSMLFKIAGEGKKLRRKGAAARYPKTSITFKHVRAIRAAMDLFIGPKLSTLVVRSFGTTLLILLVMAYKGQNKQTTSLP